MRDFILEYTEEGVEFDLGRERGWGFGVSVRALEYTGDGGGSASSPAHGSVRGGRDWVIEYIVDSGDTDALPSRTTWRS